MDGLNDLRLRQAEQVVVALQIPRPILETLPAKCRLAQVVRLDHRAHRPVQKHNALPQQRLQLLRSLHSDIHICHCLIPQFGWPLNGPDRSNLTAAILQGKPEINVS